MMIQYLLPMYCMTGSLVAQASLVFVHLPVIICKKMSIHKDGHVHR